MAVNFPRFSEITHFAEQLSPSHLGQRIKLSVKYPGIKMENYGLYIHSWVIYFKVLLLFTEICL